MPVTLRFQSSGAVPGDGAPITMIGPNLTIGRGAGNDVVLPDPDRQISKNHCVIEDQDGEITVIDFSTNGTFLNYGKTPLGRVPTPLNDGDVLSAGSAMTRWQVCRRRSTMAPCRTGRQMPARRTSMTCSMIQVPSAAISWMI